MIVCYYLGIGVSKLMKKKNILILVLVALVVCLYMGSKYVLFNYYDLPNYDSVIDKLNIGSTLEIKTEPYSEYLQFENIKIGRELLDGFTEFNLSNTENSKAYNKSLDNGKIANIRIGFESTIVDSYKTNIDNVNDDLKVSGKYMKKYFSKHDIVNDVDLVKYLANEAGNEKVSMFSSYGKMKDNYVTLELAKRILNTDTEISLLSGNYIGYVYSPNSNVKEVDINYSGKKYIIQFLNLEYFTEDLIYDILNSLVIE